MLKDRKRRGESSPFLFLSVPFRKAGKTNCNSPYAPRPKAQQQSNDFLFFLQFPRFLSCESRKKSTVWRLVLKIYVRAKDDDDWKWGITVTWAMGKYLPKGSWESRMKKRFLKPFWKRSLTCFFRKVCSLSRSNNWYIIRKTKLSFCWVIGKIPFLCQWRITFRSEVKTSPGLNDFPKDRLYCKKM